MLLVIFSLQLPDEILCYTRDTPFIKAAKIKQALFGAVLKT
jgi:hypothetical protein